MDEIPYEDKLKFTQKIKYVNQDQLGVVVQTILAESADAYKDVIFLIFRKKSLILSNFQTDKDKCQIMVDSLKKDTFYKLLG